MSKKLAWTFTPNLTHKRARVRVATLRALRGLMHCGAHETILDLVAFRHPNLAWEALRTSTRTEIERGFLPGRFMFIFRLIFQI